jgi:hypothetical protein
MTLLLLGCTLNAPIVVAHRALGVHESGEENLPSNALIALEAGFGVELDLRLDGDGCEGDPWRAAVEGCFDLGHTVANGYTLADVVPLLAEIQVRHGEDAPPLVLDVVNDPDRAVSEQLMVYLSRNAPANYPILVESSSEDGVAILSGRRAALVTPSAVQLGITYFADPEFTVPDFVDLVVVNIAELPPAPLPAPVAVYGVASASSWKSALYATSDVQWVITDFPTRGEAFGLKP